MRSFFSLLAAGAWQHLEDWNSRRYAALSSHRTASTCHGSLCRIWCLRGRRFYRTCRVLAGFSAVRCCRSWTLPETPAWTRRLCYSAESWTASGSRLNVERRPMETRVWELTSSSLFCRCRRSKKRRSLSSCLTCHLMRKRSPVFFSLGCDFWTGCTWTRQLFFAWESWPALV